MEAYIAEWLNILIRWLHFITGAAWIGTSFYFNWLNHNIREPEQEEEGIKASETIDSILSRLSKSDVVVKGKPVTS